MASGNVCMVNRSLYCGTAIPSRVPQPPPEHGGSEMFQSLYNQQLAEGCLDCQIQPIKPDPKMGVHDSRAPQVTVDLDVNPDGTVGNVSVIGLESKPLASEISEQISRWLIGPSHAGVSTTKSHRKLSLQVACFPGFPGRPETATCTVMSVAPGAGLSPAVTVSN